MPQVLEKLDIAPLVHFLSEHGDATARANTFLQWCSRARTHLLQYEPMLAIYINEHYTMPYLGCNYAIFDVDKAILHFNELENEKQHKLLIVFRRIADLVIIYMGEGPFTSQQWIGRIRTYLQTLEKEGSL